MSLDIYLTAVRPTTVFEVNVTHNLAQMARAAGLYTAMWAPGELNIRTAGRLVPLLEMGIELLRTNREALRTLEPANGWGTYENLLEAAEGYLAACRENPDAIIRVCA